MNAPFRLTMPETIASETRVILRAPTDDDADAWAKATLESVATVGPWMSWAREGYSRDDALAWIAICREGRLRGDAAEFMVTDKNGRFLGACGVNHVVAIHRFANLGYWIRASEEGRGYASEAARTLAKAALAAGLQRIEIVADARNVASQRVAERVGAQREGLLRSRILMHGVVRDAIGYSVIAEDLR